jgi:hypothetical protein
MRNSKIIKVANILATTRNEEALKVASIINQNVNLIDEVSVEFEKSDFSTYVSDKITHDLYGNTIYYTDVYEYSPQVDCTVKITEKGGRVQEQSICIVEAECYSFHTTNPYYADDEHQF